MRHNAVLFLVVSVLSGFGGTAMSLVAGIWTLDLTRSVSLAGLVALGVYLPTLTAPWLGALVDRLPRRRLLVAVHLLLAAALLTLLGVRSRDDVWLIFAVMLGYGFSYVLIDAGETALLPAALPPSALADVNGWRSSAQEGMKLIAPLAGAGLYTWGGGPAVVAVSAAMPLLGALLYTRLRLTAPPTPERTEGQPEVQDASQARERGEAGDASSAVGKAEARDAFPAHGVAEARDMSPARERAEAQMRVAASAPGRVETEVRDTPAGVRAALAVLGGVRGIRVPVTVAAIAIGLSGLTVASVYARVTGALGLPSAFLGVLAAAQGAGSIAGGVVVGRLIGRSGAAATAAAGALLFAAGCVTWCLPGRGAMITGSVAVGLGLPWTLVAAVTAIQAGTPDRLLGRVAATANTVMFGPIALTNPLGALAVHTGPRAVLLTAAAVAAGTAAWAATRSRGTVPAGAARPG